MQQLSIFKQPAKSKLPPKKKLVNKYLVETREAYWIVLGDPQVEGWYAFKMADHPENLDQVTELLQFESIKEIPLTKEIFGNHDFFHFFWNAPDLKLYKIA